MMGCVSLCLRVCMCVCMYMYDKRGVIVQFHVVGCHFALQPWCACVWMCVCVCVSE